MIKVEKISKDGIIEVNDTQVFEGQLLTYAEYNVICVVSGSVELSIDEKELVTLTAKNKDKTDQDEVSSSAPEDNPESTESLHVQDEKGDTNTGNIDSAKSSASKAKTVNSANSMKNSK